jgi:hypothetical protein
MATVNRFEDWARVAVEQPSERRVLSKRARTAEMASSIGASLFAFLAIWGFTAPDAVTFMIPPISLGAVGLLGFTIFMVVAAAAALQQRILAVVQQLEAGAPSRVALGTGEPSLSS